ncbi:hypothetical protein CBB_A0217 [Clostridium botulinum Bf]|nr:hypothetical protein CBB_A0217 [Clostridium botulinum Bf]
MDYCGYIEEIFNFYLITERTLLFLCKGETVLYRIDTKR